MGFQVDTPCVVLVTITDKNLIFHRVTFFLARIVSSGSALHLHGGRPVAGGRKV
jgi:hypothetical protein